MHRSLIENIYYVFTETMYFIFSCGSEILALCLEIKIFPESRHVKVQW